MSCPLETLLWSRLHTRNWGSLCICILSPQVHHLDQVLGARRFRLHTVLHHFSHVFVQRYSQMCLHFFSGHIKAQYHCYVHSNLLCSNIVAQFALISCQILGRKYILLGTLTIGSRWHSGLTTLLGNVILGFRPCRGFVSLLGALRFVVRPRPRNILYVKTVNGQWTMQ